MSTNIIEVCYYCSQNGTCRYPERNHGETPKLKKDFGGRDAIEIKSGVVVKKMSLCYPFTLAPNQNKIKNIQKSMCEEFE